MGQDYSCGNESWRKELKGQEVVCINHKSDFDIMVDAKAFNDMAGVSFADVRVEGMVYGAERKSHQYPFRSDKGKDTTHCTVLEDGRLRIILTDHRLPLGLLRLELVVMSYDSAYPGGVRRNGHDILLPVRLTNKEADTATELNVAMTLSVLHFDELDRAAYAADRATASANKADIATEVANSVLMDSAGYLQQTESASQRAVQAMNEAKVSEQTAREALAGVGEVRTIRDEMLALKSDVAGSARVAAQSSYDATMAKRVAEEKAAEVSQWNLTEINEGVARANQEASAAARVASANNSSINSMRSDVNTVQSAVNEAKAMIGDVRTDIDMLMDYSLEDATAIEELQGNVADLQKNVEAAGYAMLDFDGFDNEDNGYSGDGTSSRPAVRVFYHTIYKHFEARVTEAGRQRTVKRWKGAEAYNDYDEDGNPSIRKGRFYRLGSRYFAPNRAGSDIQEMDMVNATTPTTPTTPAEEVSEPVIRIAVKREGGSMILYGAGYYLNRGYVPVMFRYVTARSRESHREGGHSNYINRKGWRVWGVYHNSSGWHNMCTIGGEHEIMLNGNEEASDWIRFGEHAERGKYVIWGKKRLYLSRKREFCYETEDGVREWISASLPRSVTLRVGIGLIKAEDIDDPQLMTCLKSNLAKFRIQVKNEFDVRFI